VGGLSPVWVMVATTIQLSTPAGRRRVRSRPPSIDKPTHDPVWRGVWRLLQPAPLPSRGLRRRSQRRAGTPGQDTIARLLRWQELFPTRAALALAVFVCVIAPTTLVWLQIDANPKFSPIDEAAHFDYVERVSRGELPRQGERLTQSTLRELACRGSVLEGLRAPPCSTPKLEYEQFSATYQYEAQQPPTYYAVTVPMRWAAQKLLGIDSQLDATRATGIVWLVAGLLLLWAAGRVMAIEPLPLGASLLLLVLAPVVLYGTAIVSNDVTSIPATGLVALTAALAYRRDLPRATLVLFGAGFLAAALKTSNMFAVVSISGLFAVGAVVARASGEPWALTLRRWLRDGGALLIGGVLAAALWTVLHRSRALIDLTDEPTFEVLRGTTRSLGLVIREAVELFRPLTGLSGGFVGLSPDTLDQNAQAPFYSVLSFLLIGGGLAGLFVSPRRWPNVLGLIAVPALYVGGVVFGLGLMTTYDIDPGLSGRYALSLGAVLVLVLAASATGRWTQRALAVYAFAFFLTTFTVMVT